MTGSRARWLGIVLILIGVIFLLDSTGTLDIGDVIRNYWPLLLVIWGVGMLTRPRMRRRGGDSVPPPGPAPGTGTVNAGETLESSNVLGDVEIRVTSSSFRGGSVTTVFGDISVDCRGGGLADGEHRLSVSGVFGDCTVFVPPGVPLHVTAHTLAGDASVLDQRRGGFSSSLSYVDPAFDAAPRRLRITVSQVFGDINVAR